jgi:archaellum biogenesis ATPase FlaH
MGVFPCNQARKPLFEGWKETPILPAWQVGAKWSSFPDALPAIPVGVNGLLVIDADRHEGKPDGVKAFHELCAAHGVDLSGAFVVETPSSGLHYYFRSKTAFVGNVGKVAAGVDVRSTGNFVLGPGATLPDGRAYKLVHGSWNAIPALPDALAALLCPKVAYGIPTALREPQDATERERVYAASALEDDANKLKAMRAGDGRNHALNSIAHSQGTMCGAGWIDPSVVAAALLDAMIVSGWTTKHGKSEAQAKATIESGIKAGMLKPREPLECNLAEMDFSEFKCRGVLVFKRSPVNDGEPFSIEGIRSPFDYHCNGIEFAVDNVIPMAAISLISGAPGCGKSTLVMKIGESVSEGKPMLGKVAKQPRDVLYLDLENSLPFIRERLTRLGIRPINRFKYWGTHVSGDVLKPGSDLVKEWVSAKESKPVIIVDGLVAYLDGDENSSKDIRAFFNPLRVLANMGAAVIVLHHTGKGESTLDFRGSMDIKAAIDTGYVMKNAGDSKLTDLRLRCFKPRIAMDDNISFMYRNGNFAIQETKQSTEHILTEILRENGGIDKKDFEELAKKKGIGQSETRSFVNEGLSNGTILSRRGVKNAAQLLLPEAVAVEPWSPIAPIQ